MAAIEYQPGVKTLTRYSGDGGSFPVNGTRDGAIFTHSWFAARVSEGKAFGSNHGTLGTALTFLTIAADRPDAWVRVPTGTSIVPFLANVDVATAAGTVTKINIIFCQNDIGNGTSTGSTGPINYRSDSSNTSKCVVRHLATADTTAMTNPLELYRSSIGIASPAGLVNLLWTPNVTPAPLLIGPATLLVYVSATTTQATGEVQFGWVELDSTAWT